MIKIGITGGIGSGKSLICKVFTRFGIPIYYADDEAHYITDQDPEIRKKIIALTGEHIYSGNELNRQVLAAYIFNDKSLLEQVNRIIHPKVAAHFNDWCTHHTDHPYIIQESAILFESDAYKNFDKIVTVSAPEPIRIRRVLSRKNMTPGKIKAILRNQLDEKEKIDRSHYIVINDNTQLVIPQILHLHQIFLQISTE
jgi:dephospho-CoA kinase